MLESLPLLPTSGSARDSKVGWERTKQLHELALKKHLQQQQEQQERIEQLAQQQKAILGGGGAVNLDESLCRLYLETKQQQYQRQKHIRCKSASSSSATGLLLDSSSSIVDDDKQLDSKWERRHRLLAPLQQQLPYRARSGFGDNRDDLDDDGDDMDERIAALKARKRTSTAGAATTATTDPSCDDDEKQSAILPKSSFKSASKTSTKAKSKSSVVTSSPAPNSAASVVDDDDIQNDAAIASAAANPLKKKKKKTSDSQQPQQLKQQRRSRKQKPPVSGDGAENDDEWFERVMAENRRMRNPRGVKAVATAAPTSSASMDTSPTDGVGDTMKGGGVAHRYHDVSERNNSSNDKESHQESSLVEDGQQDGDDDDEESLFISDSDSNMQSLENSPLHAVRGGNHHDTHTQQQQHQQNSRNSSHDDVVWSHLNSPLRDLRFGEVEGSQPSSRISQEEGKHTARGLVEAVGKFVESSVTNIESTIQGLQGQTAAHCGFFDAATSTETRGRHKMEDAK